MKRLVISRGKGTTVSLKTQKYFNRAEAAAAGYSERGTQGLYVGCLLYTSDAADE